jgi:hypothetical protein
MTEFNVECVRIGEIEKLPNSDTLSITKVLGGYPVIFKTGDLNTGDLAVYIPVDAMVPVESPLFEFLKKGDKAFARIRAMKLRGTFSMGLLVAAPRGSVEGDDCAEKLGVEKYESPQEIKANTQQKHNQQRSARISETRQFDTRARITSSLVSICALLGTPNHYAGVVLAALAIVLGVLAVKHNRKVNQKPNVPIYDIEGLRRNDHVFKEGETVHVTEKIHGCNARFVHTGKRFFVGSRTQFRDDPSNVWALTAQKYGLEAKLKAYPNICLFGEVYGEVQDLDYGVPQDERVRFMAFDAMDIRTRKYMSASELLAFCSEIDVPMVPTLYYGPYTKELAALAEGRTTLEAKHVREGIVIKPIEERTEWGLGRAILKLAGEGYHLRKQAA